MPSDALHYSFIAAELDAALRGGRIDRVICPQRDVAVVSLRAGGKNRTLYLSCSPAGPRVHLTEKTFDNPPLPSGFQMHLKKYLVGGSVERIESVPYERVVRISVRSRDELGAVSHRTLIAEIMGKYSNLILADEKGIVTECARHITADVSGKRLVLPGLAYAPPPRQNKIDISHREEFTRLLRAFEGGRIDNYIQSVLSGLAPASVREAVWDAVGTNSLPAIDDETAEKIADSFEALYDAKTLAPCVAVGEGGTATDFFCRPYRAASLALESRPTLNAAMDDYFDGLGQNAVKSALSKRLTAAVKNAVSRTEKRLAGFYEKQNDCGDFESDKLLGELVTANLYRLKTGMTSFEADNYYSAEGGKITVPLDPLKTPQANAQSYYKRYAKKKKTLATLGGQIADALNQLDYFETVDDALSRCESAAELRDVSAELTEAGLLKSKGGCGQKPKPSSPHKIAVEGFTVLVGKNNYQNDRITKDARPDDIWLHTQKIHGSHAVVQSGGKAVPDSVILTAAQYAAGCSKAAASDNVPVDFTLARHVKKPAGALPGKVIYTNQRTLYVTPLTLPKK